MSSIIKSCGGSRKGLLRESAMYQPLLVLSPIDFFILIDVTLLNLQVDSPDDVRV